MDKISLDHLADVATSKTWDPEARRYTKESCGLVAEWLGVSSTALNPYSGCHLGPVVVVVTGLPLIEQVSKQLRSELIIRRRDPSRAVGPQWCVTSEWSERTDELSEREKAVHRRLVRDEYAKYVWFAKELTPGLLWDVLNHRHFDERHSKAYKRSIDDFGKDTLRQRYYEAWKTDLETIRKYVVANMQEPFDP